MEAKAIHAVYAVDWTEYERGWGQHDDGTSYHASKEAAIQYVNDYDAKYNNEPSAPDYYVKGGTPYLVEVEKEVYDKVMAGEKVWK